MMVSWDEVVNSAIEAGAVVSIQNGRRVLCYAEGRHVMTVFND